jgi:hypothetical protein
LPDNSQVQVQKNSFNHSRDFHPLSLPNLIVSEKIKDEGKKKNTNGNEFLTMTIHAKQTFTSRAHLISNI